MGHGGQRGTRARQSLAAALLAVFFVGLAASSGTSATATAPSIKLAKTVDADSVSASDPIGFRIDLTNHGGDPETGRIVIEGKILPYWASAIALNFSGDLGTFQLGQYNARHGRNLTHTGAALDPGTYLVTQADPTGAAYLSELSCDDANTTVDLLTRTATIRLEAGETIRCRFTNTDPTRGPDGLGQVIIEKQAPVDHDAKVPAGATFETTLPCEGGAFTLDAGTRAVQLTGQLACDGIAPGTYTVTETFPGAGAKLVGLSCDDGNSTVDLSTGTATIRVEANEIVRCVFVNHFLGGQVIIEKQAPVDHDAKVPAGATFETTLPCEGGAFTLDAGTRAVQLTGQLACDGIAPGTYTVTETFPGAGAKLVGLSCDDGNSTVDLSTGTATIRVEANEIVRCVFVNRVPLAATTARNVTLIDELPTAPGLEWSIDPAVEGCSLQGSRLACSFAELPDGETVSVHVTSPTTTGSCGRHDNVAVASADNRTQVTASATVTVVCPTGTIVVRKETEPDGAQGSFTFSGDAAGTISDGGEIKVEHLSPGTYHATEADPGPAFDLRSISCVEEVTSPASSGDVATRTATFRVDAGETVTCTFTNVKRGTIVVKKLTVPAGSSENFAFTPSYGPDFSLKHGESHTSIPLAPKRGYSVSESARAGWTPSVTCDDGGPVTNIDLAAGETVTCTFTNTAAPPLFLVIDDDSIDNGSPPNFFSATAVNDQIASVGLRALLPVLSGANVGKSITLHTGQVGDEGWFALKTIPAAWNAAGPTTDGLRNYLSAGPGLGSPNAQGDRKALLEKIPDVTPLRATGLKLLTGRRICAVVYDSDISINYGPLNGSLKGANLGRVALEVVSVTKFTGGSSRSLPTLQVKILDAEAVCAEPLARLTAAPAPISSSQPQDVTP